MLDGTPTPSSATRPSRLSCPWAPWPSFSPGTAIQVANDSDGEATPHRGRAARGRTGRVPPRRRVVMGRRSRRRRPAGPRRRPRAARPGRARSGSRVRPVRHRRPIGRLKRGTVLGHEVVAELPMEGASRSSTICRAASASAAGTRDVRGLSPRHHQAGRLCEDARARATGSRSRGPRRHARDVRGAARLRVARRRARRAPAPSSGAASWASSGFRCSRAAVTKCSQPIRSRNAWRSLASWVRKRRTDWWTAVLCAHADLDEALAALEPGGTLLVFAAGFDPVPVDLERVLRGELRIVGSCSATPRRTCSRP